eukprot:3860269-Pyramimonas_sp.AAC.1
MPSAPAACSTCSRIPTCSTPRCLSVYARASTRCIASSRARRAQEGGLGAAGQGALGEWSSSALSMRAPP